MLEHPNRSFLEQKTMSAYDIPTQEGTDAELREIRRELDAVRDELTETPADLAAVERERDAAQARADDLREQLAATNRRVDEHKELVAYAEQQREADRHDRERRQHNVVRPAWWWLAGEPAPDPDDR